MRVLVITPDFPPSPGGIQVLLYRLVRNWTRVRPTIVALGNRETRAFDRRQGLRVRRVDPGARFGHTVAIGILNARGLMEARRIQPALVLSAHVVTSPAAWAIQKLTGAPFVQYFYAEEVAQRPHLSRFAARRAAAVVAISRHSEGLARVRGAKPDRIVRIPPGVDLPQGRLAPRSARPLVLTISRLTDRFKGHDILIEALPLIRRRIPDVQWVVIGDGQLRSEYQALVRSRGLDDVVRFVGPVGDVERDVWLDRSHVLAMPSRLPPTGGGEGFGIVYLEAAAHGLPVVAGNVGGTLDAVVDGETGLLVDPTDPHAVANAVADLLLNRQRAESMGIAGRKRAERFAWPAVSRQVEEVLLANAAASP